MDDEPLTLRERVGTGLPPAMRWVGPADRPWHHSTTWPNAMAYARELAAQEGRRVLCVLSDPGFVYLFPEHR